jgi:hypothetical protein
MKTAEERIRDLSAKRLTLPLEVIIPILEKSGRSEQELTAQIYSSCSSLSKEIREILGLTEKNMRTLAKLWEVFCGVQGIRFQPIELTEDRYSVGLTNCLMLHVGKGVSPNVKNKFCDAVCMGIGRGVMDIALGSGRGICSGDRALIKGKNKCIIAFELLK